MAEFAPVGIRIKARGTPANMAALNGASGARSTSGLMRKRWRFGPSKSPLAQWMRGFYPNFSTKSRRTRKSVASRLMARDFDRPGRGAPGPYRRPERLHRTRHTRHASCGISPSGKKGNSAFSRFVQQSPQTLQCETILRQKYNALCQVINGALTLRPQLEITTFCRIEIFWSMQSAIYWNGSS